MTLLGIDYGSKRVGLALCEENDIVVPLKTLANNDRLLDLLHAIIVDYEVRGVVVGLPLNMDGNEGPATARVRNFAKKLRKKNNIAVELWDERLSSYQAENRLFEAGLNTKKQRKVLDQAAAIVILESFLAAQKNA